MLGTLDQRRLRPIGPESIIVAFLKKRSGIVSPVETLERSKSPSISSYVLKGQNPSNRQMTAAQATHAKGPETRGTVIRKCFTWVPAHSGVGVLYLRRYRDNYLTITRMPMAKV